MNASDANSCDKNVTLEDMQQEEPPAPRPLDQNSQSDSDDESGAISQYSLLHAQKRVLAHGQTHAHAHLHTHTRTCTRPRPQTHTHTHTHLHAHAHVHASKPTHTHTNGWARACTHNSHTYTHPRAHAYMYIYIYIHIYIFTTYIYIYIYGYFPGICLHFWCLNPFPTRVWPKKTRFFLSQIWAKNYTVFQPEESGKHLLPPVLQRFFLVKKGRNPLFCSISTQNVTLPLVMLIMSLMFWVPVSKKCLKRW